MRIREPELYVQLKNNQYWYQVEHNNSIKSTSKYRLIILNTFAEREQLYNTRFWGGKHESIKQSLSSSHFFLFFFATALIENFYLTTY